MTQPAQSQGREAVRARGRVEALLEGLQQVTAELGVRRRAVLDRIDQLLQQEGPPHGEPS